MEEAYTAATVCTGMSVSSGSAASAARSGGTIAVVIGQTPGIVVIGESQCSPVYEESTWAEGDIGDTSVSSVRAPICHGLECHLGVICNFVSVTPFAVSQMPPPVLLCEWM
jgi:hypothetical protein